jgi:hypothetical protein
VNGSAPGDKFQDFTIRVYLVMLDGWTISVDTSKNNVPLTYLEYFMDLDMVANYVQGAAVLLTHLYKGLSTTTTPSTKFVIGYMTLLQVTKLI